MNKKIEIVYFTFLLLVLFIGNSVEAGNYYDCQRCRRNVQDCLETQQRMGGIVSSTSMAATCSSMEDTCTRTCSGGSTATPSHQPLSDQQLRYITLEAQVATIVAEYAQAEELKCTVEVDIDVVASGMGDLAARQCLHQKLSRLQEPNIVRRIMNKIGARQDEFDLVRSAIIQNSIIHY